MSESAFWQEIYNALAWRLPPEDVTPQNRLNRLAREHFPGLSVFLGANTCTVRDETLAVERLPELKRWHQRPHPNRLGGKLVLMAYENVLGVIDGNNRISYHLESKQTTPLQALILELRTCERLTLFSTGR